ncbi:MAG: ATP-binding protein [Ignavibacteriota bacterium]
MTYRYRRQVVGSGFPGSIRSHLPRCAGIATEHCQTFPGDRVKLLLRSTDKSTRLSVSDNGAGFAKEAVRGKPMSFGLAGMRERAALLDGDLTIRTAPGKGVTVVLELPQVSAGGTHHG